MSEIKSIKDRRYICCICKREFIGWGNNPWPVVKDETKKCCNNCNSEIVIPARIDNI